MSGESFEIAMSEPRYMYDEQIAACVRLHLTPIGPVYGGSDDDLVQAWLDEADDEQAFSCAVTSSGHIWMPLRDGQPPPSSWWAIRIPSVDVDGSEFGGSGGVS